MVKFYRFSTKYTEKGHTRQVDDTVRVHAFIVSVQSYIEEVLKMSDHNLTFSRIIKAILITFNNYVGHSFTYVLNECNRTEWQRSYEIHSMIFFMS